MKRWRSPGTSRRKVHAELGGGGPLSPEEMRILEKLKSERRAPDANAIPADENNNNNARRDRGRRPAGS